MAERLPTGSVLVFDDDGYYMGSLMAEKLRKNGNEVYYVTPEPRVSNWSVFTDEQERVHRRLAELGVQIILNHELSSFDGTVVSLSCAFTEAELSVAVDNLVLVTCRTPQDSLYHGLLDAIENQVEGAPKSVRRIGDAEAPAIIAAAVHAGHKYARELDCEIDPDMPAKVDRAQVN